MLNENFDIMNMNLSLSHTAQVPGSGSVREIVKDITPSVHCS